MAIQFYVSDPANIYHPEKQPSRTGWHSLYGSSVDALNGNIARVFLPNIPQKIKDSNWQQNTDYTCGSSAMAIALGEQNDAEALAWLKSKGYITSAHGTEYEGIVGFLANKGYSCQYDGVAHDGEMDGSIFKALIRHLQNGYKAILCMHHPRTTFWTEGGHYICVSAIRDSDTPTPKGDGYMFEAKPVQYGTNSNSALLLEEILKARGFYKGALDGSCGNGLVTAINEYQCARRKQGKELGTNGKNDGICGQKMWADILAL